MDIEKILRWIIIGVVVLIGASLLGVLIDIGTALLSFALKVLVVVLIAAVIARFFESRRTTRTG
jgi:prepilin signal peptidase PulO-like enzyme (type II secretory pathway)